MPILAQPAPADGARDRLIQTGLSQFAALGLDGVRTRSLAEAAGVNQSAIPYYFGGKEGVYAAVIATIADDLAAGLAGQGLPLEHIDQAGQVPPAVAADRLRQLIRAFALTVLAPGRPIESTILIVREQLQPTANYDILYSRVIEPLHRAVCRLVATLRRADADAADIIIQGHALIGQVLSFAVAQQAFLRRSGRSAITVADATRIADLVSGMALAAVTPPT